MSEEKLTDKEKEFVDRVVQAHTVDLLKDIAKQPEQLKDLILTISKIKGLPEESKLPFEVYDPTPEALALLGKYEPLDVVKGLLNQLTASRQTNRINKEWEHLKNGE